MTYATPLSRKLSGKDRYVIPDVSVLEARFEYNPLTGELTNRPGNKRARAGKVQCRIQVKIEGISYITSRVIWKLMTKEEPPEVVDHQDGDPFNFKWDNLRAATSGTNQQNKAYVVGRNPSGHKGVRIIKPDRYGNPRWEAVIKVDKKGIFLGTFYNLDSAIAARKTAELKYYGEYTTDRVITKNYGKKPRPEGWNLTP